MCNNKPDNARFWEWINDSRVKLVLKEGQLLEHESGGPTEEGYWYEYNSWYHAGDCIVRETYTRSRDCDGRWDTNQTDYCSIDLPHEGPEGEILYPKWVKQHSEVYDQFAQMMGY